MAIIDNIVTVQISRQTTQIDIESFDIPLILVDMDSDTELIFTDRVRTYTGIEGVIEDLGADHTGTLIAQQLLGGDIKPTIFKIGKKKTAESYTEALAAIQEEDDTWYALIAESHEDVDIMALAKYVQAQRKLYFFSSPNELALNSSQSVTYTATVDFGDLGAATEGDKISVVIAGQRYESEYIEDVNNPTEFIWDEFAFNGGGSGSFDGNFVIDEGTGELTITHPNRTFVITGARVDINGVVTEIPKSNISATDPVGMDIAQRLKAMSMDRSIPLFSRTADSEFPEAAWVGTQIVEVPGSNTWEYKKLAGVTVSRLTDNEVNILESRGYNYYIPVKGANITRRGKVAEGEWVD